jgi:uncharacterized protein YndB with AHSA1/START domain
MEAVVIERSIVVIADREQVWRAITTPEYIAQWFEPIRFERLAVGESLTFGWGGEGSIALGSAGKSRRPIRRRPWWSLHWKRCLKGRASP